MTKAASGVASFNNKEYIRGAACACVHACAFTATKCARRQVGVCCGVGGGGAESLSHWHRQSRAAAVATSPLLNPLRPAPICVCGGPATHPACILHLPSRADTPDPPRPLQPAMPGQHQVGLMDPTPRGALSSVRPR